MDGGGGESQREESLQNAKRKNEQMCLVMKSDQMDVVLGDDSPHNKTCMKTSNQSWELQYNDFLTICPPEVKIVGILDKFVRICYADL